MPGQDVRWFRTADHYWFLALGGGWSIGVVVAWLAFLPGLPVLVGGAAVSLLIILAILSRATVLRVGLTRDGIVLRRLFSSLVVRTTEVEGVVLDPPVHALEEGVSWWRHGSNLAIQVHGQTKPLALPILPEGLKLRIARVLDPVRYPGDPFEAT